MLLVCIRSYLKSVLRYKFLILDTYHWGKLHFSKHEGVREAKRLRITSYIYIIFIILRVFQIVVSSFVLIRGVYVVRIHSVWHSSCFCVNKAVLVRIIPALWKDSTERYMEVRSQLDVPDWVDPIGCFDIL